MVNVHEDDDFTLKLLSHNLCLYVVTMECTCGITWSVI